MSIPVARPVAPLPRHSTLLTSPPPGRHAIRTTIKPRPRYLRLFAFIMGTMGAVAMIAAICLGFVMDTTYADRVLPDSTLAGRDISGMTTTQVSAILAQAQNEISVKLSVDGKTKQAAGADLGIRVDREQILANLEQQSHRPFWVFTHRPTNVPLTVSIDKDRFNSWLTENFPHVFAPAVDAGLRYDPTTNLFLATNAAHGVGVSEADLALIADTLAAQSGQGSFSLSYTSVPPSIDDDQAASALDWANQRLSAQCSLTWEGQSLYTLTGADIASLITVTGDPEGLAASVDPMRVRDFIDTTVTTAIEIAPTPQKLITDEQGNTVGVAQEGATGRTLVGEDSLAAQITACVNSGHSSQIEITLANVPYATEASTQVTIIPPPGSESKHWADVNLTTQTVTLMDGYGVGPTLTLSSGAANHPTPMGVFAVYAKVGSQSLSGCVLDECYYYPDVHWATWFYQDFGFHTAYWHNDFGTPVSHGCLNLREEDAKTVFDWLAIGDAVDVHS